MVSLKQNIYLFFLNKLKCYEFSLLITNLLENW